MAASRDIPTPLGPMSAVATDAGLAALEFPGVRTDRAFADLGIDRDNCARSHPILDAAEAWLAAYFADAHQSEDRHRQTAPTLSLPPLDLRGSVFELAVWRALLDIPRSQTRTYADIACALGKPGAARAVGLANGRNRMAIIVPCHRVIGADGSLTGYGGGLDRKRKLLHHEGALDTVDHLPLFTI
ncbi:MAG: methylated-DNA--[protein]-cysteine S-methyltransferase [Planctomycetota bacterium]